MRAITVFRDRSFRGTGREDSELFAKSHGRIPPDDGFNPWICARLEKRREKGLPTPTDYNQHQAATKIQAPFVCPEKLSHQLNHRKSLSSSEARIRGYLVRQWTLEVLGGGPRDHSI